MSCDFSLRVLRYLMRIELHEGFLLKLNLTVDQNISFSRNIIRFKERQPALIYKSSSFNCLAIKLWLLFGYLIVTSSYHMNSP